MTKLNSLKLRFGIFVPTLLILSIDSFSRNHILFGLFEILIAILLSVGYVIGIKQAIKEQNETDNNI